MNRILVAGLSLIGCALPLMQVHAQEAAQGAGRRGPAMNPEERVKMMKEQLNLSDEQAEKIKAVFAKSQEKAKALREDQSLSQEDRRAKMQEIFRSSAEEIKPILTPEQQEKWKEQMEKRRAEVERRRNEAGGEKKQ